MQLRNGQLEIAQMTNIMNIQSFNSNIQHFVGTQTQSNNCNRYLEAWMPWLFSSNQQAISTYMDGLLRPFFNSFMAGMTLQDFLDSIANPPPRPPCIP